MNTPRLETERLILRKFTENDIGALYLVLKDEVANVFLPWFPLKVWMKHALFLQQGMRQIMQSHRPMLTQSV